MPSALVPFSLRSRSRPCPSALTVPFFQRLFADSAPYRHVAALEIFCVRLAYRLPGPDALFAVALTLIIAIFVFGRSVLIGSPSERLLFPRLLATQSGNTIDQMARRYIGPANVVPDILQPWLSVTKRIGDAMPVDYWRFSI